MKKFSALFLTALLVTCAAGPAFCEKTGKPENIQTASGSIRQIDWPGETITVSFINESATGSMPFAVSEETTLSVPDDTVIRKGTDTVALSDLQVGDAVTIQYTRDPSGTLSIVSIDVNI